MTLDSFMIPTVLKCTTSVYTYVKTVTTLSGLTKFNLRFVNTTQSKKFRNNTVKSWMMDDMAWNYLSLYIKCFQYFPAVYNTNV